MISKLGPHVGFELLVVFHYHVALDNAFNNEIINLENVIIEVKARGEYCKLELIVVWVHNKKVNLVILGCFIRPIRSGHVQKHGGAFQIKVLRMEADVFELLEFDEANKFLVFLELQNKLFILLWSQQTFNQQPIKPKRLHHYGVVSSLLNTLMGVSLFYWAANLVLQYRFIPSG